MRKLIILCLILPATLTCFAQNHVKIKECIIEGGVLKEIEIDYSPADGERTVLVNGLRKKFYDVYSKQGRDYAASQTWYINNDAITFNSRPFVKYGLPRILGTNEVTKTGVYNGVGVYIEAGATGPAEVIYIPVRQGCEFQPYQVNCGTISIQKINSSASIMQLKATTSGLTGKISFKWESEDVNILQGQGTSTIIVDIKNKKDGDELGLSVMANDAKKCPVTSYNNFVVTKPGVKSTATPKWGEAERRNFMTECIKSSKLGDELGTTYCTCMLEKIVKVYPNPATADKEMSQEWILARAKECLPKK